ncbi:hypothetical protein HGRIS_007944 [Hohenbuehelia grisea]|uniref:Dihydrofolate reductase n=1 Tax=Hohenbuehelia grisea TaxID=104357 RepID=A0ABR3J6V6_9AGAR
MSRLTLIVAATKANGIGKNGGLPWRISKDMSYFAQATTNAPAEKQNAVIMGRTTWESIPKKFRPLRNRSNHVISRNAEYELNGQAELHESLEAAMHSVAKSDKVHRVFIIGGASIYKETLNLPRDSSSFVDRILLTRVTSPAFEDCDTFMPEFIPRSKGTAGDVHGWSRASHAELQAWVGFDVPDSVQSENGVDFEFQMWVRH